jgi:hypothetical protein
MSEIKGKTADRKNATLELNGSAFEIKVKPGMFTGKAETHRIPIDDIVSLETKVNVNPFPDAQWVRINHQSGAMEFFSINKGPLREIVKEVSEYIEDKEKKLKESEELFKATLESNAAQILVNLEFIDSLLVMISRLNGPVNWKLIEKELVQTETIVADNVNALSDMASSFISLRYAAMMRLPYLIKQDVYDILSGIHDDATQRAGNLTPWFPSDFHRLFVEVSMALWSLELEKLTGFRTQEEMEKILENLELLHRAVVSYTGDESIAAISLDETEPAVNRSTLYKWIELLLGAPFSLDKE